MVLLCMLARRPANADAIRAFLRKTNLPVVGTYLVAGAAAADLIHRSGQVDSTSGNELLRAADVIVTIGYDPVENGPSIWNRLRTAMIEDS